MGEEPHGPSVRTGHPSARADQALADQTLADRARASGMSEKSCLRKPVASADPLNRRCPLASISPCLTQPSHRLPGGC